MKAEFLSIFESLSRMTTSGFTREIWWVRLQPHLHFFPCQQCTKYDLLTSEFVINCLWKQEKKPKGKDTLSSKCPSCSYICPLLLSFRNKDQLFNTTWSKLVEVKMLRSLLFKVRDCFNMKVLEKMFAALCLFKRTQFRSQRHTVRIPTVTYKTCKSQVHTHTHARTQLFH